MRQIDVLIARTGNHFSLSFCDSGYYGSDMGGSVPMEKVHPERLADRLARIGVPLGQAELAVVRLRSEATVSLRGITARF
jgi:hypothetical protein